MDGLVYQVWAYIEVVKSKGTEDEKFIEDLVGPLKIYEGETLKGAMLDLWSSTSGSPDSIEIRDVLDSADHIEQEIAEGKYEWKS